MPKVLLIEAQRHRVTGEMHELAEARHRTIDDQRVKCRHDGSTARRWHRALHLRHRCAEAVGMRRCMGRERT